MQKKEILKLQNLMKDNHIDAYIAFTSDYHNSEYIVDYFKTREYLSGFTGSAGTLIVLKDSAYLWVDGRYFLQAEEEVKDSGIILMKMGQKGVPTIFEFLNSHQKDIQRINFDGKVATYNFVINVKKQLPNAEFVLDYDLIDQVWLNRPNLPVEKIYCIDKFAGKSSQDKLQDLQDKLIQLNVKHHILSSLDDIAWLLNLRGNDIKYNPVFLSYFYISNGKRILFIDIEKIPHKIKVYLQSLKVRIKPYNDIYEYAKKLTKTILIDPMRINYYLYDCLATKGKIILQENPTYLAKAIKNDTEIANLKKIHVYDGIAMVKFLYWLKLRVKNQQISEISASEYLLKLRKKHKEFIQESFETICAYKDHAAIIHYTSTPKTDVILKNENMLLVDSGGQYLYGTTDITRTIVLGPINEKEKHCFTLALKSHINLASAKFLNNTYFSNLDCVARMPLWKEHLDYRYSTGHGVGYLLNVHEGPNTFRYTGGKILIEPGMITTNEPGIYVENEFGIRHENEMLTVVDYENEYGTFLKFEPITYVPFDLKGIDVKMLTQEEKDYLNKYHKMVYETISPYLNVKVKAFLRKMTKEI